jgi:hypothetical protein
MHPTSMKKCKEMSLNIFTWIFNLGSWSLASVLNFWDKVLNNKPCPNLWPFKLLEKLQKKSIESEFIFSIWKFETQIMEKIMTMNQINSLIFNH